ncbi:MAG: DUF2723 domain-containing protein, partial [Bacteroidota bacterium]
DEKSVEYVVIDDRKNTIPVYDPKFCTVFPRMWSNERRGSAEYYKNWGGPGVPTEITDQEGKPQTVNKPTFGENLNYFFNYQLGFMYFRYFMWNFSGRQNDIQGFGGIQDGNWISGIPFLDEWRLGHDPTKVPDNMKNRATNKYYMLPFILGLLGMFFHFKKDFKGSIVVMLLFIMTGIAIAVYLNQKPYEPRERDYAYAGSFYAFAIWIGFGVIYLINLLNKYLKKEFLAIGIVSLLTLILVPGILAKENWDDHDRSGKYACRDFAGNYLNSCDKQGILFTNGDNDTFPLWYDQEVEGTRTDVRVVNLMLASGSWYINQMYKQAYDSRPLPFTLAEDQYKPGTNDYLIYYDVGFNGCVELKDMLNFIKSDDPRTFITTQNGEKYKIFPSKKIKLTVNKEACIQNGIVPPYLQKDMVDTIYWTIKSNQLMKNDLMMLDLIATNNWQRPIYFAASNSVNHCFNVDSFCLVQGWVYKFMPVKANPADYISGMGGVDPMTSYDILMNKCRWGNLSDPKVYVDPESMNNSVRPKTNMLRTAQALVELGKNKEAVKIMDEYFKNFPESKIAYDMYCLPFAEIYFKAGEKQKATALITRLSEIFSQNLDYYFSFKGKNKDYFQEDTQTALGIIKRMSSIAREYNETKLAAKVDTLFNQKVKFYQ